MPRLRQQMLFSDEAPAPSAEEEAREGRNRTGLIYTIGHSTRTLAEFASALEHYRIERLVDIRHFPSSRYNPQFNQSVLENDLPQHGIEYRWLRRLGGYRKHGYRAYMETPDFVAGIEEIERLGHEKRTVYMCAEVKWFQCHRRHVSDVLTEKGWLVTHIIDDKRADRHDRKANRIQCD